MTNTPFRRVVVKFGTSLLTGGGDCLNPEMMSRLTDQVAQLHKQGLEVIVVSSGAIASGRNKLGITRDMKGLALKQVCFAVGQSRLMYTYEQLFAKHDITIAQALLTKSDIHDRSGYLNTRNSLLGLLEMKVLCIVNENDVVAVDEIEEAKFGDNDNLSAMVANLIDADLLMILSHIEGLYTADPHRDPAARLIPEVARVDASIESLAAGTAGGPGVGGMTTKIEAAKLATACGVTVAIADGRLPDVILKLAAGEPIGTRFLPLKGKLDSRERWMLSGLCTKGALIVDEGAAAALKKNGSLLAAGIRDVQGNFQRGDLVDVFDLKGTRLGAGITNYGSKETAAIKGAHSKKIATLIGYDYGAEVVHRNNLVVL